MASLGPSPGKHLAPVFRGHAGTETVRVAPFSFVGLKGSLHAPSPVRFKMVNVQKMRRSYNALGIVACQRSRCRENERIVNFPLALRGWVLYY